MTQNHLKTCDLQLLGFRACARRGRSSLLHMDLALETYQSDTYICLQGLFITQAEMQ